MLRLLNSLFGTVVNGGPLAWGIGFVLSVFGFANVKTLWHYYQTQLRFALESYFGWMLP